MTGHEPAFYLIAIIAGLYVATRFVVQFAEALRPQVSPAKLAADSIVEIVTTAFRTYGIDRSIADILEPHKQQVEGMRDDVERALDASLTMGRAIEQLQKQMSACIANIKDIAVSLNDIAPVVAAAKSSVAKGDTPAQDVSAMSAVQSRKFFRQKPSDINGNKTSAPTANDGRLQATSAAERAAEIVEAMQADVSKATDVQFPPLPAPSADRHNRDMIG